MEHPYPLSHADLLVLAIKSRVSVICEFSTDIRFELRKLQRWASKYAGIHELELAYNDELFGIYYEDSEADTEIAERIDAEEQATLLKACPKCHRYLIQFTKGRFFCLSSKCNYSWV